MHLHILQLIEGKWHRFSTSTSSLEKYLPGNVALASPPWHCVGQPSTTGFRVIAWKEGISPGNLLRNRWHSQTVPEELEEGFITIMKSRLFWRRRFLSFLFHRVGDSSRPPAHLVPETDSGLPRRRRHRPHVVVEERPGAVRPHTPPEARPHVRLHARARTPLTMWRCCRLFWPWPRWINFCSPDSHLPQTGTLHTEQVKVKQACVRLIELHGKQIAMHNTGLAFP